MSELKWYYAASLGDFGTNVCLPIDVMTHAILLVQHQDKLYTQSISSCDKAPEGGEEGVYTEYMTDSASRGATQSQLERRRVYAYANNCPHENLPLTGCTIEHQEIVCPHHGARFSVLTGQVLAPPAFESLETYPIKIENQRIYVGINDAF